MTKRFSQACENNQEPILLHLREFFAEATSVLEIGSGTGQHSVYFAARLPHVMWQTSDLIENHASISAWGEDAALTNWLPPKQFKVGASAWPVSDNIADAIFTANTAHIMQPEEAKLMMQLITEKLPAGGVFCQYGPFRFDGEYTSQSNAEFDARLKSQGFGGYRDINELKQWCVSLADPSVRLTLSELIDMPANNHLLVWRKA